MGRCGLRADEVSYPADQHLRWSEDGDVWLVEVRGKNTAGGEPKVRDAWMPEPVAEDIHKYSRDRGLAAAEPWVSASTSTVRRWIREPASSSARKPTIGGGDTSPHMTSGSRGRPTTSSNARSTFAR